MDFYRRIKSFFPSTSSSTGTIIKKEKLLKGDGIKILSKGFPIEIRFDKTGKRIHIFPEPFATTPPEENPHHFILFDPEKYYSEISAFIRLEKYTKLVVGGKFPEQTDSLSLSNGVSNTHLSLFYDGYTVHMKDLFSESGTLISPLQDSAAMDQLARKQEQNLLRLMKIYGGPLKMLPPSNALDTIKAVNKIMENEACRLPDQDNKPGTIVALPAELTPIIIGDLHARLENMLNILSQNYFLENLENRTAVLVILGDAVHSEIEGRLEDMDGSMLIMDFIFKLKQHFPEQVFFIRGNHESYSPHVSKGGVSQGVLWKKALLETRGAGYVHEMSRYYNTLPLAVISNDFLACHASPPLFKVNREKFNNGFEREKLINQLTNNRLHRPGYPGGYTKKKVKKFRKRLGLKQGHPFIVGHNPLSEKETFWLHAGGIKNHHIIYSAGTDRAGVFTRINGRMIPLWYPRKSLIEKSGAICGESAN